MNRSSCSLPGLLSCIVKPVVRGLGQGGVALVRHASAQVVKDSFFARHQGGRRFQKLHQTWPKNKITLEDIMHQIANNKASGDKQFTVLSDQIADNKASADKQFTVLSDQIADNKASADKQFTVLSDQIADNKASVDEHFASTHERLDVMSATLNRLTKYNAKRDRE